MASNPHDALFKETFEHQSSFDATMPFRMLRYMVRVWERWLRDHPESKTLPIVLPVLLHHGEGRWKTAPELASMLDADPDLLEAVRPFQPMFRLVLDDLTALSLHELAARAIHALGRLVQLAFWSSRSMERLESAAPLMSAIASTLHRDDRTRALLMQLYTYLWRAAPPEVAAEDFRSILLRVAGPKGAEDVVNAAEQLIEQGRAEGLEEGMERGLEEGMERGLEEGMERGLEEGMDRGRIEGLRTGILAALSSRALSLSEVGRARIASCADVATLTRWLTFAVTSTSEAAIFQGSDSA